MRRRVWTRSLLAGALLALACTDQNPLAPELPDLNFLPPPSGACSPSQAKLILSEIKQTYRARPLLELEAAVRFAIIALQCPRNLADAQARTVRLSGFAAQKFQDRRLLSSVAWSDVSLHIDHLYQYVALTPPHIPADAVGEGSAVAVVEPTDPPTTVKTGDNQAGVFIPTGAFSQTQTVLLTIVPDPNGENPFPNTRGFQEFGPFYNYQTFPELLSFNQKVLVGICVDVTEVPDEQAQRLQLAHPRHPDLKELEILPRVEAGFLGCESIGGAGSDREGLGARGQFMSRLAQHALALFRPQELHAAAVVKSGGLGGETSSFSDFRAIDPGSERLSCDQEGTIRSLNSEAAVNLTFDNRTQQSVSVYWLDYYGQRVLYTVLEPNQSYVQSTFVTHPWIVIGADETCYGIFLPSAGGGTVVVR